MTPQRFEKQVKYRQPADRKTWLIFVKVMSTLGCDATQHLNYLQSTFNE
jgi:hypothetical protein